jgi:hypothetical protein
MRCVAAAAGRDAFSATHPVVPGRIFAPVIVAQAATGRVFSGIEDVRRTPMRSFPIHAMAGAIVLLAGAMHDARASEAVTLPPQASNAAIDASAPDLTQSDAPPAIAGIGAPLPAESLQSMRGGDSTTNNNVDIDGNVDGNTATNVVSGSNVVQGGSFANSNGISTVIQNSGSNVLIQNGTVVNVQFVDPGQ